MFHSTQFNSVCVISKSLNVFWHNILCNAMLSRMFSIMSATISYGHSQLSSLLSLFSSICNNISLRTIECRLAESIRYFSLPFQIDSRMRSTESFNIFTIRVQRPKIFYAIDDLIQLCLVFHSYYPTHIERACTAVNDKKIFLSLWWAHEINFKWHNFHTFEWFLNWMLKLCIPTTHSLHLYDYKFL